MFSTRPKRVQTLRKPRAQHQNGRMDRRLRTRRALNLANGSTALGLALARLGGCTLSDGPRGLVLAEGYRYGFPVAGAFTVGNVILTSSTFAHLEELAPGTLRHEDRHATQWAFMLGLPFLPAYLATMAWSWARTGDRAAACWFEQDAGLELGGYRRSTPRDE